jgi:hypothetical protein
MSKVAIKGATTGTATFTIESPATNTDRTLVLPDNAGTVLTSASNLAGVAGVGKVLQVVNATTPTQATSSSSTYADTGLSATITPTSATSKILVLVNQSGCLKASNNTFLNLRLVRDATQLIVFEAEGGSTANTNQVGFGSCSTCFLDAPATTSAITYKTQFNSDSNSAIVFVQVNSSTSTITLMEIAA